MSIEFTANHPRERDFRADDEGVIHVSMHIDVWQDDEWQAGFELDLCPNPWSEHGLEVRPDQLREACSRAAWVIEGSDRQSALMREVNRALTGMRAAYDRAQQDCNMRE